MVESWWPLYCTRTVLVILFIRKFSSIVSFQSFSSIQLEPVRLLCWIILSAMYYIIQYSINHMHTFILKLEESSRIISFIFFIIQVQMWVTLKVVVLGKNGLLVLIFITWFLISCCSFDCFLSVFCFNLLIHTLTNNISNEQIYVYCTVQYRIILIFVL